MLRFEAAMDTDIGSRETNQDCLFAKMGKIAGNMCGLFCVADGMGGLSDGLYAATVAVEAVEKWWEERLPELIRKNTTEEKHICYEFYTLFENINNTILYHANEKNVRIGTTCSLMLIFNNTYCIAHVGDSRIYEAKGGLLRKKRIKQLTDDHTWGEDQFRKGRLTWDEIKLNTKKNKLISCLGAFENPQLFVSSGSIERACTFILCSDGLYRLVSSRELASISTRRSKCVKIVTKLMTIVDKRGAKDNTSVIVVKISGKIQECGTKRKVLYDDSLLDTDS